MHATGPIAIVSIRATRTTNSPTLVKREAGFPNPWRVLIGSNQLWRVNGSPYYREYCRSVDIIKFSFLNENIHYWFNFFSKLVTNRVINYMPALVQIITWDRSGDKTSNSLKQYWLILVTHSNKLKICLTGKSVTTSLSTCSSVATMIHFEVHVKSAIL